MTNLRIETIKISSLTPDPTNARRHDSRNLESIKGSLKLFGQRKPIVVTGANVIVAGNGTVEAAKDLGWSEILIVRTPIEWTPEQVKAYALADNRTAELAEWDAKVLADQLIELDAEGWDVAEFGFDPINPPTESEDDEPLSFDEDKPTRSKLGDLWQVGKHRIYCGDSLDKTTFSKILKSEKVDFVLTDPPYGMFLDTDWSDIKGSLKSAGAKSNTSGKKYDKVIGDNDDFTKELIETIFDNLGYVKEMFIFGADYFAELLPEKNKGSWLVWDKRKPSQEDAIGAEFELIWSKNKHKRRVLRHDWFGFLSSNNAIEARNRVHPTQKPTTLLKDILQQWSKKDDLVFDIYAGSGSTFIACEKLGKKCYGIELDPKYVDVIIDRLEKETGLEAELLES
jgi:site-specific DNA-methyltransferase (adenine-specific)